MILKLLRRINLFLSFYCFRSGNNKRLHKAFAKAKTTGFLLFKVKTDFLPSSLRNLFLSRLREADMENEADSILSEYVSKQFFCLGVALIVMLLQKKLIFASLLFVFIPLVCMLIKVNRTSSQRKKELSRDLLLFVETLRLGFSSSQRIDSVLEDCTLMAGSVLSKEIKLFLADYRSSVPETAIFRFTKRISLPEFQEIAEGLYAVQRGDNTDFFWNNLVHQTKMRSVFSEEEKERVLAKKIRIQSLLVVSSFTMLILFSILTDIIQKLSSLF